MRDMCPEEERVARIDSELKEIIPDFFRNTWDEIRALQEAVEKADWQGTVTRLGHSIKGSSLGYGFEKLAELGLAIETAARGHGNADEIRDLIRDIISYLEDVEIIYE
jgi:HPt (histidine-containing phosphotransfer) domain-containing protein